ncbi:hypothetical protein [Levilactobacillus spicheri]|uniref:Uncharacterized protein n=2 Tax=Levilactobacillus spicheri TaxID=216463 RepID=A0ABQ0WUU3_9LACO|nr:hypothetical protein [Levilactobacillus spicheri]KRL47278.1 hypothetical protein FD37_GL002417 [Levilactobacillus spicheri DSM 15429]GEO68004.1 hypothetical protein LSP04_24230 [Levilactobacillus spicheri]
MNIDDLLKTMQAVLEADKDDDIVAQKFEEFGPQRLIVSFEKDGVHVDMPRSSAALPFMISDLFDEIAKAPDLWTGDRAALVALMSEFVNRYLIENSQNLVTEQEANARG